MILTGIARLGSDTTVRYTPKGDAVANLSLAFNYGQKGTDGKTPTQWVDASLWGKRAESLAQYLTKGTQVNVVLDAPHIETFTKRDGGEGSKLVARVVDVEFAGGRANAEHAAVQAPAPSASTATANINDMADDIPF